MKKILCLTFCAILAFSLVACADKPESPQSQSNSQVTETPAPTPSKEPVEEISGTMYVDDIININPEDYIIVSESVIDIDGPVTVFYTDGVVKNGTRSDGL